MPSGAAGQDVLTSEAVSPPAQGEVSLGTPLIPQRYTYYDRSGLAVEVPEQGMDSVLRELAGDPSFLVTGYLRRL